LGSPLQNNQVKLNQILFIAILLLLAGCSSITTPSPIQLEPTPTLAPISTVALLPTSTSTVVPIFTDISCQPSSNPFAENPMMSSDEYHAGYYPNIAISRICTFEGQVSRGQIYEHQIIDNLIFCLVPSGITGIPDEGWHIVISDSRTGSCDFNSENYVNFGPIVTPPFHGNLFFDVYGWHFRNKENTGENNGSLNTPQKERFINFVFDREDYDAVWYSTRCMLWGVDTDCALATQTSTNSDLSWSRAKFTITELELGNLVPGSHAWIEHMEFKFEAYLP
jgi:hypothetical protein